MQKFSRRLKRLREEKNLTQVEFAKLMSLANSTISQYEAGRRMPDQEILQKFADFFDVSVDYLLGRTNNPKSINNNGSAPTPEQCIAEALADDPELLEFFQEFIKRDDLQLLFKQVKPLSPKSIKKIIRVIKAIEEEEEREG